MNKITINKQFQSRTTLATSPESLLLTRKSANNLPILTWDNMYGDFLKNVKEKLPQSPNKARKRLLERDPLEENNPLN